MTIKKYALENENQNEQNVPEEKSTFDWKKRLTNLWFYVGLVGVVLTATGANPEMFTSWSILIAEIKSLLGNPYLLGTAFLALLGVLTDPTTKGLKDGEKHEDSH